MHGTVPARVIIVTPSGSDGRIRLRRHATRVIHDDGIPVCVDPVRASQGAIDPVGRAPRAPRPSRRPPRAGRGRAAVGPRSGRGRAAVGSLASRVPIPTDRVVRSSA
jgi:hypothetical protein